MHQARFLQSPYPIVQMSVKTMLPVEDNCKRSIKRYRPHLPTPAHRGELTIPAELTTTLDQDPRSSCTTMGKMPTTGLSHLPQKTISDSQRKLTLSSWMEHLTQHHHYSSRYAPSEQPSAPHTSLPSTVSFRRKQEDVTQNIAEA